MSTTTRRTESAPDARPGRAALTPPSFLQAVWLVAQREIQARLRSKAFLISTGILLVAILASVVIGSIVSSSASTALTKVAVVGSASEVVSSVPGFDVTSSASVADAEALVRDGSVDAAIIPAVDPASPLGITVVGKDSAPTDVVAKLSVTPAVQILEPTGQNPFLAYIVALFFGLVFFMSAITFGSTIAQSVVEEKQTRVVEILMSTISVRAMLAGKVLGNSILAFAQIAVIAGLAGLGLGITGQTGLLAQVGPSLIWFVVFFVFGFVLLASLYSATASLVSRQEDVGSVTSPVTMLVMAPYILVLVFNSNPVVMAVMSYVPFSAPVGMPVRLFLGTAEWWEPLVSLVILLATTAAVVALGSRIYAGSLLRTGKRVKLREALRG